MKILFNTVTFGSYQKCSVIGDNKLIEFFDDKGLLTKTIEMDKFERDVDTKIFENGDVTFHLHKEYDGNKITETFKGISQEYTRIINTIKKGNYTHRTEEYISKTSPENNYINEFIKDCTGKLVKIINNGKIIDLIK